MIRVLILINKDIAELVLIDRQYIRIVLEELDRIEEDIVEVHGIICLELVVIALIDLRDCPQPRICTCRRRELLRRLHVVLGLADDALHESRRKELIIQFHLLDDFLDDLLLVVRIDDRIGRSIAEKLGMTAEDTRKHRVERTHPHVPGNIANQPVDTLTHLIGRLVRERDRQDA